MVGKVGAGFSGLEGGNGGNVERNRDKDGYGSRIRSREGGWEREGVDVGDGDSE